MWDILRSNDAVVINLAQAVLNDASVGTFVADLHMSIVEGSIGAFPRRIQVAADDWAKARRLLADAGLMAWLVADDEAPA
jgi:putative signal transducing protein